jgi:subtilisin family serine protease
MTAPTAPPPIAPPQFSEILQANGHGVRVLVVDSGVESDHPIFQSSPERPIQCWRVAPDPDNRLTVIPGDGTDAFGHGTAVAGIIRQHASGATIDSIQVLGDDLRASSAAVLAGLSWGIEQRYDLINCSFGSRSEAYLPAYKRLVDHAFCSGSILVSACDNFDFRSVSYPASFPTVLAADFAPMTGLALRRRPGHLIEFIAPGEAVHVAWKGGTYRTNTGSSFASPHLAALVARIRELRPSWNACQIKSFLYEWAER